MKKILIVFLIFAIVLLSFNSMALSQKAYIFKITEDDISGENFQIFLLDCTGHYDSSQDIASLYVTNTSDISATFQLHIGYNGTCEKQTYIDGVKKELQPGESVQFAVSGLKNAVEKANTDLGYVPNSTLSEKSVVRVSAVGLSDGDTFKISGVSFTKARNTYFKEYENFNEVSFNNDIVSQAETIDESSVTPSPEPFGKTLTQPSNSFVNNFIAVIGASAVLCTGGIIIYTVSTILKRRNSNERN